MGLDFFPFEMSQKIENFVFHGEDFPSLLLGKSYPIFHFLWISSIDVAISKHICWISHKTTKIDVNIVWKKLITNIHNFVNFENLSDKELLKEHIQVCQFCACNLEFPIYHDMQVSHCPSWMAHGDVKHFTLGSCVKIRGWA